MKKLILISEYKNGILKGIFKKYPKNENDAIIMYENLKKVYHEKCFKVEIVNRF